MFDIIGIGDTTVDMFLDIDDATVLCDSDKERCRLTLQYGSKIPVKRMCSVAGAGNAANHMAGCSRLGLRVALYTHIGADERGRDVTHALKNNGISRKYVVVDRDKGTNYSTVINYLEERTILAYHEQREYQVPKLKTPWIYFSSVSGNVTALHEALAEYVQKNTIKLGFNPGTLQMKLGLEGLAPILKVTEVLFVNKDEAEKLVGVQPMKDLLTTLHATGPKMVVITDGPKGSYCYDGKNYYQLGIIETPVLQRTGCGDAYASGFVSALISDKSVETAMRWGSANAAGVVQHPGPHAGLLSKNDLERVLKSVSHFHPSPL